VRRGAGLPPIGRGQWRPLGAPPPKSAFEHLEQGFVVIALILFSEALFTHLFADPAAQEASRVLRLVWPPLYAIAIMGVVLCAHRVWKVVLTSPMLLILPLIAIASATWSINPDVSFRRGIAILFTTLFGIYLAARFSPREALRMFAIAWLVIGLLSFFMGAALPSMGVMHEIHVGAWRGVFVEKNTLGGHMAKAAFLFAMLAWFDPSLRKLWLFGLLLAAALVLLSTSKTSLLGLLLGLGVVGIGMFAQRGPVMTLSLVWLCVFFGVVIGAVVALAPEFAFGLIGREPTLTGRTDIWATLAQRISERPWLGYGYAAFWGLDSLPAHFVRETLEWDVPTAHNGWLETCLSIGLVGLALFAVDLLQSIVRALRRAAIDPFALYATGFILQFVLFSISESTILQQNSISWVAYVFVSVKLGLMALRAPVPTTDGPDLRRHPRRAPDLTDLSDQLRPSPVQAPAASPAPIARPGPAIPAVQPAARPAARPAA